jgi:hypothetical protein
VNNVLRDRDLCELNTDARTVLALIRAARDSRFAGGAEFSESDFTSAERKQARIINHFNDQRFKGDK